MIDIGGQLSIQLVRTNWILCPEIIFFTLEFVKIWYGQYTSKEWRTSCQIYDSLGSVELQTGGPMITADRLSTILPEKNLTTTQISCQGNWYPSKYFWFTTQYNFWFFSVSNQNQRRWTLGISWQKIPSHNSLFVYEIKMWLFIWTNSIATKVSALMSVIFLS